jgi:hypothetical protein
MSLVAEVTISRALDPSTNFLSQATKKLKKAKQDHELQQYLMNYCAFRVEEGDKNCEAKSFWPTIFQILEVFDHQTSRNKSWIKGLLHQIHLMSNGSGVLIAPIPIKSLSNLPTI